MNEFYIGERILQKHGYRIRKLFESLTVILEIQVKFGMPLTEENFEGNGVGPDVLSFTTQGGRGGSHSAEKSES